MAFAAGGCEKKIDGAKAQEYIKALVTSKGVSAAEVTCPGDVPAKKDSVFICKVKADGVSFDAEVTQKDDSGNVNARTKGVVFPGELQAQLLKKAQAQVPEATVDCGAAKVKAVSKGDRLKCVAKMPSGEQAVEAEVKDEYGTVDLVPPKAEPPPAEPPPAAEPPAGEHPPAAEPPTGEHPPEGEHDKAPPPAPEH